MYLVYCIKDGRKWYRSTMITALKHKRMCFIPFTSEKPYSKRYSSYRANKLVKKYAKKYQQLQFGLEVEN